MDPNMETEVNALGSVLLLISMVPGEGELMETSVKVSRFPGATFASERKSTAPV
jgi:hypothetical protein